MKYLLEQYGEIYFREIEVFQVRHRSNRYEIFIVQFARDFQRYDRLRIQTFLVQHCRQGPFLGYMNRNRRDG